MILVLLIASGVRRRNIKKKPYYRYYVPAVFCKLVGGISVCLIYTYYYKEGGDASNYFLAAKTFVTALLDLNFPVFFNMLDFYSSSIYASGYAENDYGVIYFSDSDHYALFTTTLSIPFCLFGLRTFIGTTLLLAYFSFLGLWKLYEVFVDQFPTLQREFAIAIFFIPSVFFWGSGLLKDTYTLSALGFFTYCVYRFLIKKNRKTRYLVTLIISSLLLIFIKPYIFFAALPGSLIWIFFNRVKRIQNPLLKVLILPIMLVVVSALIFFLLNVLGDYLGEYSIDKVLDKAVKTQQDLVRGEAYGGNNFDIGKFDATLSGVASKIPVAINLALFRPYIWDARNPVMILSGLENLFMLGFSLYILIKVKFTTLFSSLFSHPLLVFSFLFSLFFAFSVGLTTANYGALVRLKIPCIPFYLCSLYILFYLNKASFKRRLYDK